MENLLAKAEWWLERNMQEMPLMGDGKVKKEGERMAEETAAVYRRAVEG